MAEEGQAYWLVKCGLDNDGVEERPGEHAAQFLHWVHLWVGIITSIACLPHHLEERLKAAIRNMIGVLALEGHKRVESS